MNEKSEDLNEWLSKSFNNLHASIDNIDYSLDDTNDINYFTKVGIYLTIFTIFETELGYMFENFAEVYSEQPIINFPTNIVSKLAYNANGSSLDGKLDNERIHSFINFLSNRRVTKKEILKVFHFKHFNENNSNDAIRNAAQLFEKNEILSYDEKKDDFWFEKDLKIPSYDDKDLTESIGFSYNKHDELFSDYICRYSTDIRHQLVHRIPNGYEISDVFSNYPIDYSVKVFEDVTRELLDRYYQIHNVKIKIDENQNLLGPWN